MKNNKNKKSVKFQGDMLNFCDFIQVFVFTRNHHLNPLDWIPVLGTYANSVDPVQMPQHVESDKGLQ